MVKLFDSLTNAKKFYSKASLRYQSVRLSEHVDMFGGVFYLVIYF